LVTGQLGVVFEEFSLMPSGVGVGEKSRDLEAFLARAFETYQPLIALGKPGEHIGAGRIETDDASWQEKIDLLLKYAATIVMIPSYREGTLWEVDWLRANDALVRTLFLLPPTDSDTGLDVKSHWEQTAARFRDYGIILPPFDRRGAMFYIQPDGRPGRVENFPKKLRVGLVREILRSLATDRGETRKLTRIRHPITGRLVAGLGSLALAGLSWWLSVVSDGYLAGVAIIGLLINVPLLFYMGYSSDTKG
jgi:hypothetical protein